MNATAWSGLIGGIVVAMISVYGVVRTAKVARLSNDRMAAIEGWKEWRADAAALREERNKMAEEIARNKAECDQIADQLRRELRIVEDRLEGCVDWIRAVVPLMAAAGVPYPTIPKGITDTDPGMPAVRRP